MTAGQSSRRAARVQAVLAGAVFAAVACWAYRSILHAPASVVPAPVRKERNAVAALYASDQRFVIGNITANARRVVSHGSHPDEPGPCFPLERAFTLGEHMFGESILATLPWLASHDPILTYNVVLVLSAWLAAMSMYALAFYWTRDALGAVIAGILFAFHPARIGDPAHPFVYGNLWTPLALLFAHRLVDRGRWRDAVGLALFLALQLLESFYQVLALLLVGGVYGGYVLARHAASLRRILPKIALVVAVVVVVAFLVFAPYLHTRAIWGVLQGRAGAVPLYRPFDYLPGGKASVGWLALGLAAIGLADRLRRRIASGADPRLVMLAGGALVLWSTLAPLNVPLVGVRLPSPIVALAEWVPGLDAVRVLPSLRFGFFLVVDFLAAYGVVALTTVGEPRTRRLMAVVVAGLTLVVLLAPPTSPPGGVLAPFEMRPAEDVLEAYRDLPPGAVLDLPVPANPVQMVHANPIFILLGAFHGKPVAACYNSFTTALQEDVRALARRLPDPGAADALYALGFRTVVVHHDLMNERAVARLRPLLEDPARASVLARTSATTLYRLTSPSPTDDGRGRIGPPAEPDPPATLAGGSGTVEFSFANGPGATWVHPAPIEPSSLVARWRDAAGAVVTQEAVAVFLPAALGAGQEGRRLVMLHGPATPAIYQVELAPASDPAHVLATRQIDVVPAGEGSGVVR